MVHSQGREEDEMVPNGTKVLYYDIETAPSIAAVWELFSREDSWAVWVEVPRFMLCFSYKWGDEKQVHWVGLPQFALYKEDPHNDLEVVKKLHELFCEADIIIAYNGNAFDHKIANARFLAHGLTPPPPMRQIDPLLIARKEFKLPSNKLEDVGRMLKVGVKFPGHDREMWRQCYHGNLTAWALMKKYNKQDVVLLEKVYLALRPWSSNHPRMVLGSTKACPKCGEKRLQRRGYSIKKTLTYQRWQCQVCGGWCQSRFADKDIESPLVTD
jgi:DNA polymerase elongation subunit (family B)